MISFIIWLWTFLCPNPYHTIENHGDCTKAHMATASAQDAGDGDTGGETGSLPPKPTTPPPPPPPGN
ncbi:MAG: hypothetical protein GXC78_10080 [Chitinophagaceae bacterium]|nr:hypothetical protein [Chitinophagaceae bacterium]